MKSKSGVAGGVRSSAPQNFGVFPDSGMVYAPHRPKIVNILAPKISCIQEYFSRSRSWDSGGEEG